MFIGLATRTAYVDIHLQCMGFNMSDGNALPNPK